MKQDELKHYGVKGMRWGVTRAQKKLARASTEEQKDAAVASLHKHRSKATAKVTKLESKRPKLQKAYDKTILKTDVKIAKVEQKRNKYSRKANRILTTKKSAARNLAKAQIKDMKVKELRARSHKAKAYMAKNEKLIELFNQGISDIDSTLVSAGRKYINS